MCCALCALIENERKNYRNSYKIFACNGILFNHESPRRGNTFVTQKIITEEQTAQATSFFKLFEDPVLEEKGIQIPIELEDESIHENEDSSSP